MTISIESLLAARLFLSPKLLGNRLFFLSNLGQGGHLSLYAMDAGGSVPEPLLPARIALPNPELVEADVFALFPKLGKLLLMPPLWERRKDMGLPISLAKCADSYRYARRNTIKNGE